jgi:hypothetical protein
MRSEAIMSRLLTSCLLAALAAGCEPPDLRFVSATHVDTPITQHEYWSISIDASAPPTVQVSRKTATTPSASFTASLNPAGEQRLAAAVQDVEQHWEPGDGCYDDILYSCTTYSFEDRSSGAIVQGAAEGDLAPFLHDVMDEIGTCAGRYLFKASDCP